MAGSGLRASRAQNSTDTLKWPKQAHGPRPLVVSARRKSEEKRSDQYEKHCLAVSIQCGDLKSAASCPEIDDSELAGRL